MNSASQQGENQLETEFASGITFLGEPIRANGIRSNNYTKRAYARWKLGLPKNVTHTPSLKQYRHKKGIQLEFRTFHMKNKTPWEGDAPENAQYPKNDNGENFIFWLAAAPFRVIAAPFRFVIGIVSVRRVEDEIAKRGLLASQENPNSVDEIVTEYGDNFYRGNKQ